MGELKILENVLVPVYLTSTGEKVVYGTELYDVLGIKSNYRDWVKNRLSDCEAIENEDFQSFAKNLAKGGRPQLALEEEIQNVNSQLHMDLYEN